MKNKEKQNKRARKINDKSRKDQREKQGKYRKSKKQ